MKEEPAGRISQRIKIITADLKRYVEKRIELTVITVGEQYARWIAESIQKITGILLLVGALVFLLIALAIYLGSLLGSDSLGYVVVSLPLFLLGYLLFNGKPIVMKKKLKKELEEELIQIFDATNRKGKSKEEASVIELEEPKKNQSENHGKIPGQNIRRKEKSIRSGAK